MKRKFVAEPVLETYETLKKEEPEHWNPEEKLSNVPRLPPFFFFASVALSFVFWLHFLNLEQKIQSLIGSTGFAIVEFLYRGVTIALSSGRRLGRAVLQYGHTTWEQWGMNALFMSPLITVYHDLVEGFWLRVLLFPILVWLGEVIVGYFFFLTWRKRAWNYEGKWALFHGNITLDYIFIWWLYAIPYELVAHNIIAPASALICEVLLALASFIIF